MRGKVHVWLVVLSLARYCHLHSCRSFSQMHSAVCIAVTLKMTRVGLGKTLQFRNPLLYLTLTLSRSFITQKKNIYIYIHICTPVVISNALNRKALQYAVIQYCPAVSAMSADVLSLASFLEREREKYIHI